MYAIGGGESFPQQLITELLSSSLAHESILKGENPRTPTTCHGSSNISTHERNSMLRDPITIGELYAGIQIRAMPFPRSRARTSTLLKALLIIITIFLFVISASRPTSASRVFPGIISDKATVRAETQPPSTGRTMKKTRDALLQKYFSGNSSRASGPSGSAVTGRGLARGGFGENKRKVPSCPDPLHN